jgi:hypothetical protein
VGNAYRGDMETEVSTVEYLLVYPEQEGAPVTFLGVEHISKRPVPVRPASSPLPEPATTVRSALTVPSANVPS